jgi:hypothetical protein
VSEDWTPYALEKYRIAYLRRRRLIAILIALLLLLLLGAFFSISTDRQTTISANGKDQNGNSIEFDDVPGNQDRKDHITVELSPGRVTNAETGTDNQAPQINRATAPQLTRAAPYNWGFYLLAYGPYVLVGLLMWFFGKRRSRHDEVNYGVFKGAMPLELTTASHKDLVFTRKFTKISVFGRRRENHLPREIALVPQEDDG